jgi:hypothetical protein
MNPIAAVILAVLIFLILRLSKRGALLALLSGALYLSQSQRIDLLGLNLFPTRLLEIALAARLIARHEWSFSRLTALDKAFVALYIYATVVFLLRSPDGQAFRVGMMVDAFIVYFSCRSLIESPDDFRWLLRSFVLLLIPFVLVVIVERITAHSPLAFMGWGASDELGGSAGWVREGRLRCFGSFRHPSLLGTLGVSFMPLLVGMAFRPEDRRRAVLGIVLCVLIVLAANSGGPVSGVGFGCAAWMCWKIRAKMRLLRWGLVAFVCLMAVVMKAPVWYLIAHVSSVTGGDGWHRAYLMQVSYDHLRVWWLAGMPLADTVDWFPYSLQANAGADITNQFIWFGITAGIGATALFVLVLQRAFSALGKALEAIHEAAPQGSEAELFLWGLGAMLATHIVTWLGITYFDQTYVFWFMQLAAISSLSDWYMKTPITPAPKTAEEETDSEMTGSLQITAQ